MVDIAIVTFQNYAHVHEGMKSTFSKEVFDRQCKGYKSVYEDILKRRRDYQSNHE